MKKYKKRILKIIFLIGISLLLYPTIGSIINKYLQLKAIDKYAETIYVINKEDSLKYYDEAISYNEEVYIRQKEDHRYDLGKQYENVLKFDSTGIMGYIEIPKANIKLPIYHGVDDSVLQKGVGHVRESSLPIGTNNQNSLLMGHSGLPASKIFTNLEKIKLDDYLKITVLDNKLYYKIVEIKVIEPKDLIDELAIQEGKDLVTLVTCTPYGVNSHRLIISGERTLEIPKENEENTTSKSFLVLVIIASLGLLLITGTIYLIIKKRKKPVIDDKTVTVKENARTKKLTSVKKQDKMIIKADNETVQKPKVNKNNAKSKTNINKKKKTTNKKNTKKDIRRVNNNKKKKMVKHAKKKH